jgi:hypothetical protein
MSAMMHPTRRDALLQSLEKPHMVKAKLDLNFLESGGKLVRLAYQRAGMSQKEAMAALGIDDPAQFQSDARRQREVVDASVLAP